jgi:hypothetical protein
MMEPLGKFELTLIKDAIDSDVKLEPLKKQVPFLLIESRKFNSAGGYINFYFNGDENLIDSKIDSLMGGNYELKISPSELMMGHVIYVVNGFIKFLELYTFDEVWDEKIEGFEILK